MNSDTSIRQVQEGKQWRYHNSCVDEARDLCIMDATS